METTCVPSETPRLAAARGPAGSTRASTTLAVTPGSARMSWNSLRSNVAVARRSGCTKVPRPRVVLTAPWSSSMPIARRTVMGLTS